MRHYAVKGLSYVLQTKKKEKIETVRFEDENNYEYEI